MSPVFSLNIKYKIGGGAVMYGKVMLMATSVYFIFKLKKINKCLKKSRGVFKSHYFFFNFRLEYFDQMGIWDVSHLERYGTEPIGGGWLCQTSFRTVYSIMMKFQ